MNKVLSLLINLWVGWTGRKQNINEVPWLNGPYGKSQYIGGDFYKDFAKESFSKGWTYITSTSLANYLEKA